MELSENQFIEPIHQPVTKADVIIALIDKALEEYEEERIIEV